MKSAFDLIIPFDNSVPLHRQRLKQRGLNQSLVLAREIAGKFNIPVDFESPKRIRDTGPQVSLGGDERRKNVRHAFEAADSVKGKRILLIDDVLTTGSAVRECARTLIDKDAVNIAVYTVARAVAGC